MHETTDGQASISIRRDAELDFRAHYQLSAAEYSSHAELCRGGEARGIFAAYLRSLPLAVEGVRPTFVHRIFADDRNHCCGSMIMIRRLEATVYERNQCCQAWHYVKQCTGGCAAAHYFNKMTVTGATDADDITWHCFYPWTSGDVPEHIPNKSGRSIVSTELINDVALANSGSRYEGHSYGEGECGGVVGGVCGGVSSREALP